MKKQTLSKLIALILSLALALALCSCGSGGSGEHYRRPQYGRFFNHHGNRCLCHPRAVCAR